jgi:plastocyanin
MKLCTSILAIIIVVSVLCTACVQPGGPAGPATSPTTLPLSPTPAVTTPSAGTSVPTPTQTQVSPSPTFGIPKKSAHYESNTPPHGGILAGVPVNVVIDFNFDLGPGSVIRILNNGVDYGTGNTLIDANRLAMRRMMNPDAPDGVYTVDYDACWPDGSCHDGNFQFAIMRSRASDYTDLRGMSSVNVTMRDLSFIPSDIRIDRGATVTWINEEGVEHYVNTDSHPYHTYYLPMNSRALKKGDAFTLRFDTPGIYPYHCSAHAEVMFGSVLVE